MAEPAGTSTEGRSKTPLEEDGQKLKLVLEEAPIFDEEKNPDSKFPLPETKGSSTSEEAGPMDQDQMVADTQLTAWVATLGIPRIIMKHLPRPELSSTERGHKDALSGLLNMTDAEVEATCKAALAGIVKVMKDEIRELKLNHNANNHGSGEGEEEHSSKFDMWDEDWNKCAGKAFKAKFGKLEQFYKGLDWHLGLPNPNVMRAMQDEHTKKADSLVVFSTHNYGLTSTTPAVEWEFVVHPQEAKDYPGKLRQSKPLASFLSHEMVAKANLTEPEVVAMRLYTGPMYQKYNASLRGFPSWDVEELRGNRYVTTIHAIVSGVVKLSRVWHMPDLRKLYRGQRGCQLPDVFWQCDEYGCRGGVEYGLLSTSTKWSVAANYASLEGGMFATVFEIDVGQVDRGASMSWLSQYPAEEEILMPPLSNLEVVGRARMEQTRLGKVMVIPLRVNVNIKTLLLDELLARRKMLHVSMVENLYAETRRDVQQLLEDHQSDREDEATHEAKEYENELDGMMLEFKELVQEVEQCEAAHFNDDRFYHNAMAKALAVKKGTLCKWTEIWVQQMAGAPYEVLERIWTAKCIDFARPGFIYYIRSGTNGLPWDALAERKLKEVELPLTLTRQQAKISWECIRTLVTGPVPLTGVSLRGQGQTTVKIDPKEVLMGTTFALGGQKLGPAGSLMLVPAFRQNQVLCKLDLSGSRMSPRVATQIARVLAKIPSLQTAKIRGAEIPVKVAKSAASIDLPCKRVGDEYLTEDAIMLAECLRHNQSLTRLDIRLHLIRADGASALSNVLIHHTLLEYLNLQGNHVRTSGAVQISEALQSSCCLKQLVLSGNKLGIQGARALIGAIQSHPQLEVLNGIENTFSSSTWNLAHKIKEPLYESVFVATRIKANTELSTLSLAGNILGRQGANTIKDSLKIRDNLTSLDLSSNNLRSDGIETIAEALLAMKMLVFLDLSHNQIGVGGTISVAKALVDHPHLKNLVYIGNIPGRAFPELDILFLKLREPYKNLFRVLPKSCEIQFFGKNEFRIRVASLIVLWFGSIAFGGSLFFVPSSFGTSLAAYNTSIVFLSASFLGLFVWMVRRRALLKKFGVVNVIHAGYTLSNKKRHLMIDLARIGTASLRPVGSIGKGWRTTGSLKRNLSSSPDVSQTGTGSWPEDSVETSPSVGSSFNTSSMMSYVSTAAAKLFSTDSYDSQTRLFSRRRENSMDLLTGFGQRKGPAEMRGLVEGVNRSPLFGSLGLASGRLMSPLIRPVGLGGMILEDLEDVPVYKRNSKKEPGRKERKEDGRASKLGKAVSIASKSSSEANKDAGHDLEIKSSAKGILRQEESSKKVQEKQETMETPSPVRGLRRSSDVESDLLRFSLLRNSLRLKVVANAAVGSDSDDDDDLPESNHMAKAPGSSARIGRNKRVLHEVEYDSEDDEVHLEKRQTVMAELCKRVTHFSGGYLNDVMAAMRSGMENSGRLNVLQSPKPLATALSQSWFQLVLMVVVLYFVLHSVVGVVEFMRNQNTFMRHIHYKITAHELRNGDQMPIAIHLQDVGLIKDNCNILPISKYAINNSILAEYNQGEMFNGWYFVTGNEDPDLDPVNLTLSGSNNGLDWTYLSSSTRDCALSIWSFDWEMTRMRNTTITRNLQWSWMCVVARFNAPVLALGFLACLGLGMYGRPQNGNWVLAGTFWCVAVLFLSAWVGFYQYGYRKSGWWLAAIAHAVLGMIIIVFERYLINALFVFTTIICTIFGTAFSTQSFWGPPFDIIPPLVLFLVVGFVIVQIHKRRVRSAELALSSVSLQSDEMWKAILQNDHACYSLQELREIVTKMIPNRSVQRPVIQRQHSHVASSLGLVIPVLENSSHSHSGGQNTGSSTRILHASQQRQGPLPIIQRQGLRFMKRDDDTSLAQDQGAPQIKSLDQLYAQAINLQPFLRAKAQAFADASGGCFLASRMVHMHKRTSESSWFIPWKIARGDAKLKEAIKWGKIKDPKRAMEKALHSYRGEVFRLLDITRQSIYFEDIDHISTCLGAIWHDEQIVVERIKNRMDAENSDAHNIFGGYRDVSLNIRIVNDVTREMGLDLHVCELRLVLQCFAEVVREDETHSNYLKLRNELGWLPVL